MDRHLQDLRYAVRGLRRSPVFTVVAVLSLAIGIGANTAIFGIADALLFRTLPVPHPDRLVLVDSDVRIGHARFGRLQELSASFSGMSAVWTIDRSNVTIDPRAGRNGGGDEGGQTRIGLVSADYFTTLGLKPIVGRAFTADENRYPGGQAVAVISDDYWRRRLARAPDVVGRTFRLNGVTYDIVGVTPAGFAGEWVGMPTDLWVPFAMASKVMPEVPGGRQSLDH